MAVPTDLTALSVTAASNSPSGSDSIGVSLDDFLRIIQAMLKEAGATLYTSAGTADVITFSTTPTFSAYQTGQRFYFLASGANTGAVTLNINAVGAKAVTREGTNALVAGDIPASAVVCVVYDGTRFILQNVANSYGKFNGSTVTASGLISAQLGLTVSGAAFTSRGITDNATVTQVQVTDTASANRYITLTGAAAGGAPVISVGGATNNNLTISSAGTGDLFLATQTGSNGQVKITNTTGATNLITMTGSVGGNPTIGTSAGSLAISSAVVQTTGNFVNNSGGVYAGNTTATTAGGSTTAAFLMGTSQVGLYFGSGAPTISASQGSLYLRTDGSSTSTRMYVNTNGTTGWTAVTTAT